jgi:hypothetical protein
VTWARDLGGADARQTGVSFILRSDLTAPVIVANVRVIVQQRSAPMRGTLLQSGQGGDLYNRVMEVNLDNSPPRVRRVAYENNRRWNFPLRVSQQDPEVFTVIAKADNSYCLWKLEVDYLIEGGRHTLTVDDGGQPFRTTGVRNVTGKVGVPQTDTDPWP